jgi:hypothetical protein
MARIYVNNNASSIIIYSLNTEYVSPNQHGGIYGTVYRTYFGATLPAALTAGNNVSNIIDSSMLVSNGSNRYRVDGWGSDGSSYAQIVLSTVTGKGNLTMAIGATFSAIISGFVDYTK